jgi:hypothetical protein
MYNVTDESDLAARTDYSRGYDRGNYGNAYESQDWETWSSSNKFAEQTEAYREGMLLGFFSSYELHEIADEDIREQVEVLRAQHGDE